MGFFGVFKGHEIDACGQWGDGIGSPSTCFWHHNRILESKFHCLSICLICKIGNSNPFTNRHNSIQRSFSLWAILTFILWLSDSLSVLIVSHSFDNSSYKLLPTALLVVGEHFIFKSITRKIIHALFGRAHVLVEGEDILLHHHELLKYGIVAG